ncbi:MAG: GDSL-type esterase/lipase family protein [Bifidobacteriaceae bacterium]|nr:GDSL-type esterase/lipase family protein [Bifidobacteriaceae bacterium]
MNLALSPRDRVLFLGDSVTDADRNRADGADLGAGYAAAAAARLFARPALAGIAVFNRGVGGDRAQDVLARLGPDCLDLAPTVVSLLVGINDTWRRFDSGLTTTAAQYSECYRTILTRIVAACPAVRLILIEPFVVPVSPEQWFWRSDLDPRIAVVRRAALDFGAALIPADGMFAAAAAAAGRSRALADDGVHPTAEGHRLLAEAWLALFDAA